jgi:hypothetical protein
VNPCHIPVIEIGGATVTDGFLSRVVRLGTQQAGPAYWFGTGRIGGGLMLTSLVCRP